MQDEQTLHRNSALHFAKRNDIHETLFCFVYSLVERHAIIIYKMSLRTQDSEVERYPLEPINNAIQEIQWNEFESNTFPSLFSPVYANIGTLATVTSPFIPRTTLLSLGESSGVRVGDEPRSSAFMMSGNQSTSQRKARTRKR